MNSVVISPAASFSNFDDNDAPDLSDQQEVLASFETTRHDEVACQLMAVERQAMV
jgi:hypothetical protein